MAATPLAERPTSLKILGIGLLVVMLFFVWLTYAFFNKSFVKVDEVLVDTGKAGLNLPSNADVKLRGMIVGSVRDVQPVKGGVKIVLGMKPELIDRVPADVSASIIPKTLFGEKYIALIPGEGGSAQTLKAGDVIERAEVPIEVETLLNDLYPLLQAVEPAELSYTLSAVAQALEGHGEQLGETLVKANDYFEAINPDLPTLVEDIDKLGTVSDGYAKAMPQIGRLLKNTVVTGNTVVAKRTQLAAFFNESTRLANTLTTFTKANGDNLEALASQSREILAVTSDYANTLPCFLGGMARVQPLLASVMRNNTVHIDLEVLAEQPGPYQKGEEAVAPSHETLDSVIQADPDKVEYVDSTDPSKKIDPKDVNYKGDRGTIIPNSVGAVCKDLEAYKNVGEDSSTWLNSQKNPFKVATEVYKLIGVNNTHSGKFGDDESVYERAAVADLDSAGFWNPSLADADTAGNRAAIRSMAAAVAGVDAEDVPEAASLLLSPILRGAEANIR